MRLPWWVKSKSANSRSLGSYNGIRPAPRAPCQRAMASAVYWGIQIQAGPPYLEEGMCR
jgi:hypothetical protein